MLVLTRKQQEKIRIGDQITVTVLKMKGKTVRLGIEAPTQVPVVRGELSFEGQAVQRQSQENDGEPEPPRPTTVADSHVERARDHWPTKSPVRGASPCGEGNGIPPVSVQRIPRELVSKVLPKMVPGPAPLRAMIDRRSVST